MTERPPGKSTPAERPVGPAEESPEQFSSQQWYEFIRSPDGAPAQSRAAPRPPVPNKQRSAPAQDAKVPNENVSQSEARLLTTLRTQVRTALEPIRDQIGELRNQLTGGVTEALNKLANQQVVFQGQLIDRQGEVLGQLVASAAAAGNRAAEQIRAESSALRDDLTALVRDELAKAATDRQVFQQQLIDRQGEVLAKLANPLMAERNLQSKQMRAETRALRDQLRGFIGDQFAKLAQDHDRLTAQRDAARSEPVTTVPAELETALGQIRHETEQLRKEIMATIPAEREARLQQTRHEHQQLREEITGSVRDPIIDRIATVAEEHARFRARLVAVARVVEARFDAFEARIQTRLDQAVTATSPKPPSTAKETAPRAAAKKVAPRAGAKKPVPRAAPGPKRTRRPS